MKRIHLFLLLVTCFRDYIKEVRYNKFISPFWTLVLLKDGVSLHLEIGEDKILPFVNKKTHSFLEHDEVFPFIIGLYNLQNTQHSIITKHLLRVS